VLIKINTEPKALGFCPLGISPSTSQKPDTIQTIQGPHLSTVQSRGEKNKKSIYLFIIIINLKSVWKHRLFLKNYKKLIFFVLNYFDTLILKIIRKCLETWIVFLKN